MGKSVNVHMAWVNQSMCICHGYISQCTYAIGKSVNVHMPWENQSMCICHG